MQTRRMPGRPIPIVEETVLLALGRVQLYPVSRGDHLLRESPGRREQCIVGAEEEDGRWSTLHYIPCREESAHRRLLLRGPVRKRIVGCANRRIVEHQGIRPRRYRSV